MSIKQIAMLEVAINAKRGTKQVGFETTFDVPPSPSNATVYYKTTVQARDTNDKIIPDYPAVVSYFKVLGPS